MVYNYKCAPFMKKYLYGLSSFALAFGILSVSVLRYAALTPVYGSSGTPLPVSSSPPIAAPTVLPEIDYTTPYPGKILPDNWLWYIKALRDRSQLLIARDNLQKAELALLFSDKRLGASLALIEKKKPDLAVSVLAKGEKYLEMAAQKEELARKSDLNTTDFLTQLATASLYHRQIIEEKVLPMTPEDLKPEVSRIGDYSKNTYKFCRDALNSKGIAAPIDPFNGQ